MSHRLEKINELIRHHIAEMIPRELDLKPGVLLTVSRVDTTEDLRYTRVFVSIFPENEIEYVMRALEKEVYSLQGILNKKLSMRPLPRIEFRVDKTESNADEVEKILNKMRSEK